MEDDDSDDLEWSDDNADDAGETKTIKMIGWVVRRSWW